VWPVRDLPMQGDCWRLLRRLIDFRG